MATNYLKNLDIGGSTYTIDAAQLSCADNKHILRIGCDGIVRIDESISLATKDDIETALAASDAMLFKGTLGDEGNIQALPEIHSVGDSYKVITARTYAGVPCEVGDLIICITDGTTASDSDWTVVQTNTDGVVTGPSSSTNDAIAAFSGTSGKVIKNTSITLTDISTGLGDINTLKTRVSDLETRVTELEALLTWNTF